jgi:hypothetical protein
LVGPRVVPVSPAALATQIALVVHRVAAHGVGADRATGGIAEAGGCAVEIGDVVRVGIDGPVTADTHALAAAVRDEVARDGTGVAAVHAEDFVRARSLRLEYGVDGEAYYERWYDRAALRREVLDPLGPGGTLRYLPRLRDAATDRAYRDLPVAVPAGTVAVVDGRFLGAWELSGAFDVLVFLDVSPAARLRRLPEPEREPMNDAWQRYLEECDPASRATLVLRFDHPDRPALVEPG